MTQQSIDIEVLTSAFSEVMPCERARSLAINALEGLKSLPGVLESSSLALTDLKLDTAAIAVVRQLGTEMRRSLARSFAGQSMREHAKAFHEYVLLLRTSLKCEEVRLLLFDACHSLTADISCHSHDVRSETPVFRDIVQQTRLARAQSYMLVHHEPADVSRVFINRLTTCCLSAGLVPFSTESEPFPRLQRSVSRI
ncbi:hypothetical protein KCG44_06225 [Pacificimonas sp. WHA3]|uniref:Uncharacterized protein n=1 Tax=Pacificimonas pallii TaxID=2827236 RepID=A0ABS6SEM1_9SPHN|nr:hypothetical protein [Pacificimonas pallii]MBV7256381.1 hypothetical protein [Pacificimonas pallii]